MNLVFVHLNSKLPRYLKFNLKLHVNRFPNHKVVALYSDSEKRPKIPGVEFVPISQESRWLELDSLYTHPKNFRSNFWLTSSARLYALEQFMKLGIKNVLHIESDVILSEDFPFKKFEGIECGLAYPLISKSRAAASTVYIRDLEAARLLTSNLIKSAQANPQTTEMLALKELYDENRSQIQPLPLSGNIPIGYRNISINTREKLIEGSSLFGGAFDGVEVGQYFYGTDPRNRRGRILLNTDLVDGYVNLPSIKLKFDKKRRFPNLLVGDSEIEIQLYSLHLPSKEWRYFSNKLSARALQKNISKIPKEQIQYSWRTIGIGFYQFLDRRLKKVLRKKPVKK